MNLVQERLGLWSNDCTTWWIEHYLYLTYSAVLESCFVEYNSLSTAGRQHSHFSQWLIFLWSDGNQTKCTCAGRSHQEHTPVEQEWLGGIFMVQRQSPKGYLNCHQHAIRSRLWPWQKVEILNNTISNRTSEFKLIVTWFIPVHMTVVLCIHVTSCSHDCCVHMTVVLSNCWVMRTCNLPVTSVMQFITLLLWVHLP